MSSRALRRAQKELEERQRLEALAQAEDEEQSDDEVVSSSHSRPSLYAMLGEAGEESDGDEGDEDDGKGEDALKGQLGATDTADTASQPKKNKKKKKKGKGKAKMKGSEKTQPHSPEMSGMDEIDRALHALNLTAHGRHDPDSTQLTSTASEEMIQLCSALAVDTQHLHAANEMRKLFGRAALRDDDDQGRAGQRGRGQQQGLAGGVVGRNTPGTRNLASLGLRRNVFIQGKEEWPRATTGGLSMEIVQKRSDGTVEYRFVHNRAYQDVQRQFETCVASMDAERMVQLLQHNPYHVSTLLQVSEIAKQQRDNAAAGDLLERALFTFGRAVHSTFSNNLSQGKVRLDFRRPENREFWLAVWRYIVTLGIRSTWRTAFEWAKLLLSLAPEDDPYCMRLLIDQLALRGREPQNLVDIVESDHLQRSWKIPPNLAMSVALAYDRLKQPEKARSSLRRAVEEYPWVAARLCKELEISPIPKSVWGKEPHGDYQELLCQLYVSKAKDLWNTPEATSLLVEVAYSFGEALPAHGETPYWLQPIDENALARHVILCDDKALLSLLDARVKAKFTSVSDPLPPEDSIRSYSSSAGPAGNEDMLRAEIAELRAYFQNIDIREENEGIRLIAEHFIRVLEQAGSSIDELIANAARARTVRDLLEQMEEVPRIEESGEPRHEYEEESESESDV